MDINQVYKAPSIPKLSKRNISSPVLRGAAATTAAKPKLTRSRFSFLKPKISAESLKTEAPPQSINETLAETNQILVEIQKQLSLDFAMRIAEEKETLKNIKDTESKRKFAAKEKFLESTKKISGAVGGVINKVSAPIKSVFEKIKEFFGLLLTGIVVNNAFNWLQNKGNREKLEKIFEFVGTYWKEILGTIVGIQIASALVSVAGTIATVVGILTNPILMGALLAIVGGIARIKEQERIKPLLKKDLEEAEKTLQSKEAPWYQKLGASIFKGQVERGPTSTGFDLRGPGSMYSTGGTIPNVSYNFNPSVINKNSSTIQRFSSGGSVRGYAEGGTFERLMGTVRGTGSMMVDSVKALLAPGEEIIRATSAMLFRPLLKDINDNAGRMWVKFSEATKKLLEVSSLQTKVSEEFSKVIEDHDKYLKDDIIKKRTGQGGGYSFNRPKQSSVTPTQKIQNNIIMSPPGSGGINFLPMVLPKQSSKPPQIPQMNNTATEVVPILSFNVVNPWMDVTPGIYDIQLYA